MMEFDRGRVRLEGVSHLMPAASMDVIAMPTARPFMAAMTVLRQL